MAARIRRLAGDPYRLILVGLILAYIWVFAGLAFQQHLGMRTHKADLGQIDQAVWNSSRGRFLESVKDDFISTRLTDHVEPIFVLISPVLWLWDDVRALLLLQVVAVALGAWFVYELALLQLSPILSPEERGQIWHWEPLQQRIRPMALAFALAYLLAPQLQSAVLTEFHAIPLAVPLILWAFWAVERQRWGQFALAALLVTGVKEEAALLGAGLGLWALWRVALRRIQGTRRDEPDASPSPQHALLLPLAVTGLSLLWFWLATFVIVPAHAQQVYDVAESSYFQRYGALGNSPADIFKSFFTQPGLVWQIATEPARVRYLRDLLAPFGFLSLLAPEILLLSLPVLLANLLSAYPAQYYGEFHYSAPLVPYVAVSAVYGGARLWRGLARRARGRSESFQHLPAASGPVMALAALASNSRSALRPLLAAGLSLWLLAWSVTSYAALGRGPLGGRYDPTPIRAHHRLLARFVAQIPPDARVSATAAVHPHVSHRRYITQFPLGLKPGQADWALLDVTTNTDMAPGDLKAQVEALLAQDWGVVDGADGFLLLRRGAPDKTIPDAFYDFARVPADEAQSLPGPRVAFGPLTFLGLELEDWPRWRQTKVTTFWRAEPDFAPGTVRPWLELRTPSGERITTWAESTPPALVWYPPERWRPGEVLRITTLWLFLPRSWGSAVGAIHGPDPLAPGDRLAVQAEDRPALLDESGTLALVAAYARQPGDTLAPLPVKLAEIPLGQAISRATGLALREAGGRFGLSPDASVEVRAWLPRDPVPGGRELDLWLQWQGETGLLGRYVPFVHLRQAGENRSQNDGPPRYFLSLTVDASPLADWRQLTLPAQPGPGPWQVVLGLYDPASGERLPLLDPAGQPQGSELLVGSVQLAPPLVPDQACALIPSTCASQVR